MTDEAYKSSMSLVQESVTNIRTVASFGNEGIVLKFLSDRLAIPDKAATAKGYKAGAAFGFS